MPHLKIRFCYNALCSHVERALLSHFLRVLRLQWCRPPRYTNTAPSLISPDQTTKGYPKPWKMGEKQDLYYNNQRIVWRHKGRRTWKDSGGNYVMKKLIICAHALQWSHSGKWYGLNLTQNGVKKQGVGLNTTVRHTCVTWTRHASTSKRIAPAAIGLAATIFKRQHRVLLCCHAHAPSSVATNVRRKTKVWY